MAWACWNCHRGFSERDIRSELPNVAVMTMDDNELRKRMVRKCPHCGSVRIYDTRAPYPDPPTGDSAT